MRLISFAASAYACGVVAKMCWNADTNSANAQLAWATSAIVVLLMMILLVVTDEPKK
jgi:hypothetical protein